MVSLKQLQTVPDAADDTCIQYCCQTNLNLYDSPTLVRLATQARKGRHLKIGALPAESSEPVDALSLEVCLCEDGYPGWLAVTDLEHLELAVAPYQPSGLSEAEIQTRLEGAIAFTQAAIAQPNYYLWGGTVGPNYDCSGLVQAAFASVGVWLPRDAYQQEAFAQKIALSDVLPGDLIFFGPPEKATHVGLYLGNDRYIHSSGKDQGRNGIGIDRLFEGDDLISQTYRAQLRGAGRIVAAYQPHQGLGP